MCLIAFSFDPDSEQKLFVLANRDEFYGRPTKQAGFWEDEPGVLAGRDLEAGGTWLGVHSQGRFAAVTNFREPGRNEANAVSRGMLVKNFLTSDMDTESFLNRLDMDAYRYNGYNLISFDGKNLGYHSNRSEEGPILLKKGVYGLSNHLLDTPWPKVVRAKQRLIDLVTSATNPISYWTQERPLKLLEDQSMADDKDLPQTGVSLELERVLSAMLIKSPNYGTRCTTMVGMWENGSIRFAENTLHPADLSPATLYFEHHPDR